MKITHKKDSLVLTPTNDSQVFLLGRLYQKFPHLGLELNTDIDKRTVEIEIPDISIYKLLIDCLDKFDTQ